MPCDPRAATGGQKAVKFVIFLQHVAPVRHGLQALAGGLHRFGWESLIAPGSLQRFGAGIAFFEGKGMWKVGVPALCSGCREWQMWGPAAIG
jgi:hypothetical protein